MEGLDAYKAVVLLDLIAVLVHAKSWDLVAHPVTQVIGEQA